MDPRSVHPPTKHLVIIGVIVPSSPDSVHTCPDMLGSHGMTVDWHAGLMYAELE